MQKDVSRKGARGAERQWSDVGGQWTERKTEEVQGRGYAGENNLSNRCNLRINVCDVEAYEFNRIIGVFTKSGIRPRRPVISVPLSVVWVATSPRLNTLRVPQ